MKNRYVAGFLFSEHLEQVALVEKQRPAWQQGKLNAIGGKIELGETPDLAMRREFAEETGMLVEDWTLFAVLGDEDNFRVYFYTSKGDLSKIEQKEDEAKLIISVEKVLLKQFEVIVNLRWLIPLAINRLTGVDTTNYFEITEK